VKVVDSREIVSVSVLTYNHEKYINETLESILNQKTKFKFKIIVSDDHSKDNTRKIIKDLCNKFPGMIVDNSPRYKLGMGKNFVRNISHCRGKYIAICDGDDLWTDEKKLQIQFDALENDKNLSLSFHKVSLKNKNTIIGEIPDLILQKDKYEMVDLVKYESFMATSSIMYRNSERFFPYWFNSLENIVDLPLNITRSGKGGIHYIAKNMGIYRSGSGPDAFSSKKVTEIFEEANKVFRLIDLSLNFNYHEILLKKQVRNLKECYKVYEYENDVLKIEETREILRRNKNYDYRFLMKIKLLKFINQLSGYIRNKI
jgi:glycosyltransferase involved in cell wall biosynthesis